MLGKILVGLGIAGFFLGVIEAQSAFQGSHKQIEAGLLILGCPVIALIGLLLWRRDGKKCPHCAERVKRQAIRCKHCGSELKPG